MQREILNFETVNICPSWAAIVPILILVLQNQNAAPSSHKDAQEELMKLARAMDAVNKKAAS